MSTLYISQNGITDHIGESQIAPYVLGLAKLGYNIHILSAEKSGKEVLIEQYKKIFADAGINWTRVNYHNKPALLGTFYDLFHMFFLARKILKKDRVELVHCRSFYPAIIGYYLKWFFGVKYIFDFRDFSADGGIINKPFKFVYRYLKKIEGPLILEADKVVCLTQSARTILSGCYLSDSPGSDDHFQIIPCCADFQHFDLSNVSQTDTDNVRSNTGIAADDFVLLYLGSLGPDYLLKHMITLFRQLLAVQPKSRFLFVSNNGSELVDAECAAQGISHESILFLSANRKDIPTFLSVADMSVVFIRGDLSKAGCSPTKLAELFACGVPVIANTGVGDLDRIISLQINGSMIVEDFSDETLRAAVLQVIAFKKSGMVNIRENSREFALEEGVVRYAAVYQELLDKRG